MGPAPNPLELEALRDWAAAPGPGLSLLHFDSLALLDPVIEEISRHAGKACHRLSYDPRQPEGARNIAAQCRRLAEFAPSVIWLVPPVALPAPATAPAQADFWKTLNSTREALGALPARVVLCLDSSSRPFAFSHARDLISWCSPRFNFGGLPDIAIADKSISNTESYIHNFETASASTWATLRPHWETALAKPTGPSTKDLETLLLPLMEFAVASGSVALARRLREEGQGLHLPEQILARWLGLNGELAMLEGSLRQAQFFFLRALHSFEELPEERWNKAALKRNISLSQMKLGDVAVTQGDLEEADRRYAASLAIRRELADSDPENAEWQRDLYIVYSRLGDTAVARGNLKEASRRFGEALIIAQKLAESNPDIAEWQRDFSFVLNKLGDIAVASGDLDEAARHFTKSLAIRERLANSDPGNAQWQRDLSVSHDRLGDLALARGDLEEAASRYAADLAIASNLAESDPGNTLWQRDVASSHIKFGDIAVVRGEPEEATRRFTEGLTIRQRLADSDPCNAQWQRDLYMVRLKLANLAQTRRLAPEATKHFRIAHDILDAMDRRGLHLSPSDRIGLRVLKQKLGLVPADSVD